MAAFGTGDVKLLAGLNDAYILNTPENSGAIISVSGDYEGSLSVDGYSLSNANGVSGARGLLNSLGVPLGTNIINNDGSEINSEFLVVNAGQSLKITMLSYVSGLAYVRVVSSAVPSHISISGYADSAPYKILTDQVNESTTYIGKAYAGSGSDVAVWRVSRLTDSDNDISLLYADGSTSFDKIWDNRAGYSYS